MPRWRIRAIIPSTRSWAYITNHRQARTLIRKLDRDELLQTLVRSYLGK